MRATPILFIQACLLRAAAPVALVAPPSLCARCAAVLPEWNDLTIHPDLGPNREGTYGRKRAALCALTPKRCARQAFLFYTMEGTNVTAHMVSQADVKNQMCSAEGCPHNAGHAASPEACMELGETEQGQQGTLDTINK